MKSKSESVRKAVETFAAGVQTKFKDAVPGREEDLLRRPVDELLEAFGATQHLKVVCKDESPLPGQPGRPDFAVTIAGLLSGYLELKAPGTGVDPQRFKGHNQAQWQRFQHLPNLVYTDGIDWALFRNGKTLRTARFPRDITREGVSAISTDAVDALGAILSDFFQWHPIVPESAEQLAKLLAPLCRLLRDEVLDALHRHSEPMRAVARDWRRYLFPDASDDALADSYAQTVVFALLLARSDGADTLILHNAVQQLSGTNTLLSRALEVLTDDELRVDIGASVDLLQRAIQVVPSGTMSRGRRDPWLNFYEDFLAQYDPVLRKDAGAYYTPVEVVQAQVRLVDELLRTRFDKRLGFADGDVATLDPAVGTGTYLLSIVEHSLEHVRAIEGHGALAGRAESLAKQLYGFEIMVGPYAVAALRLTRMFHDFGAKPPQEGIGICLTNTLESPHEKIPELPLLYRPIGLEHKRARTIKDTKPVLVCIGNPPYDRHAAATAENLMQTGAWVRWGESKNGKDAILNDFIEPVKQAGKGGQLKNLYNLYVYFWRWALWKVFEHEHPNAKLGPGIVTFITAASYLDGEAFLGMREHMRRICDEIWILDLGGEGRGTRQDENVFNIQTPVAIAIAARYGAPKLDKPAKVHYCQMEGDRTAKLKRLDSITGIEDLQFEACPDGWHDAFRPKSGADFFSWPNLSDLLPWQQSGIKAGRTWVIGTTREVLLERLRSLSVATTNRAELFKESPTGRKLADIAKFQFPGSGVTPVAFRSFDRQYIVADQKFVDRPSPPLWESYSSKQLYISSLSTQPLSMGPAVTVAAHPPDLHCFRGSFGAKDVHPLYRDAAASTANLHPRLSASLDAAFGAPVDEGEFAAYVVGVLAHPGYAASFQKELGNRQIHVPVTLDRRLFEAARNLGQRLIYLHTYGERFAKGQEPPIGNARCTKTVTAEVGKGLPESFAYDPDAKVLTVGAGIFAPVSPEVWDFDVSGFKVVQSWLAYRMKERKGRKSSPLDAITPPSWPAEYTSEFLKLLHCLEETLSLYPKQDELLKKIVKGKILSAKALGLVPDEFKEPPASQGSQSRLEI